MMAAASPTVASAQVEEKSIWDGVFTQEQADRGKKVN
jgi:hypothetical protein